MLFRLTFFVAFILSYSGVFSQDIIVRTNNDSIRAKVVEITIDKIKYSISNQKGGPILEIHKNNVKQIIYENGSKLTIVYNRYEIPSEMIIREKSHMIKADLLSPILNHFTIGYEWKYKLGKNIEIKYSLIGSNLNKNLKHAEGFFVKAGVKFISLSNSYSKGLKYINPMKGNYFKPELVFSQYKKDEEHENINYKNYALNIIFGRQYMLSKIFALDFFSGIGFGIQSSSKEIDFSYAYSHLFFGKKIPLILTGGLTIGVIL